MYNHQLDIFLSVAENGSFTKAAEKLYITPTAVMQQMNHLEGHLDLKLFDRTPRGIQLTKAGEIIQKGALDIRALSRKAISEAARAQRKSSASIRLGSSLLNPAKILTDIWRPLSGSHPDIRLQIVPFEDNYNSNASIIEKLGEKIDMIVAPCDSKDWLTKCGFLRLGDFRICVAVPYGHPLAEKESLTLSDLYEESLVMVGQGSSIIIDQIRAELSEKHPRIKIYDTDFYYEAAVFNQCETENRLLLTLDIWADVHPSLITLPVDWDYSMPYGILYPLNPSDEIKAFLSCLPGNN